MTSPIQQLFCTHCTYGTAALHRHTGGIQDQVFEYSTRAGSVPQQQSHEIFQKIESLIYFHLPGDTPGSEWLKYHADNTPWQRMLYFPAINGQQLFARICYRTTDTRGRPGSYFAHVLLCDTATRAITALDVLRMWAAEFWVSADSAEHSFDLPPIERLSELPGYEASIRDAVLWSFLTTAPGAEFCDHAADDPRSVIPERWRNTPVEERQALLRNLLHGAMELDFARQERMVVAVEPALAALLFYGVLRLLPPRGVADQLSVSTFESHLDRPVAMLTASAFFRPEAAELLPEIYRARAYVQNTWKRHPPRKFQNAEIRYPTRALSALLQGGWNTLDAVLEDLAESGAGTAADYEDALRVADEIDRLVALDPKLLRNFVLPEPAASRRYGQRILARRLANAPRELFRALAVNPAVYLPVLDLVGSDPQLPGAETATAGLLRSLPNDSKIRNRFLELPALAVDFKQRWLKGFFKHYRALPLDLPALWRAEMLRPDGALAGVVERLTSDNLMELSGHVPAARLGEFVGLVARACEQDPGKRGALTALVRKLEDDAVANLLALHCEAVVRHLPPPQPDLTTRLQSLLTRLPQQPDQFHVRLTALNRGNAYLPPPDRNRVQAWREVASGLEAIATMVESKKGLFGGREESHGDGGAEGVLQSLSRACGWSRTRPWNAELLGCVRELSVRAAPENGIGWERVRKSLWPGQIRSLDDDALIEFLNSDGAAEWLKHYPPEDGTFGDRLAALLATMVDVPRDIEQRAHALSVGRGYVPRQAVQIQAWERVMYALGELRTLRRDFAPEQLKGKQVELLASQLGAELAIALREKVWPSGSAILNPEVIQEIGRVVIGDDTLWEASVVHKTWYDAFLKSHRGS